MDRLKAMQTFVRIVEANSYTKAAESLDLPRAALTATIQKLEAYLGTQLLQRTTRTLSLTSDGAAYFRHCLAILAAVDEAEAPFRASDVQRPQGRLRIELQDSALVARPIGTMRSVTCAAPSYLAEHGTPRTLDDLAAHSVVLHFAGSTGRAFDWDFIEEGAVRKVDVSGTLATNDADGYATLALQGLGLVQIATYLVRDHLARGALVEVLADTPPTPMPVSLVYPQGRMASPKMQVFTRWLEALFAAHPELCREI